MERVPPDNATRPRISVVIPVLNDAARLARCLASVRANTYPRTLVEVIVADNGSTDDSASVAARYGAIVLSIPGRRVATVRNEAVRRAAGDIIAFIDADHEIDREWLEHAAATMADPLIVGAGASYSPPPGGQWVQRYYHAVRGETRGRSETEWIASGNLAVRRAAFDAVGGFDDSLETCEDVDLCQRLRARGGVLVADEALKSVHFGDPDTLRAVLRGELWRGRDNIRVTLRAPLTMRSVPSAAIPVLEVALMIAAVVGLLAGGRGVRLTSFAAGGFVLLVVLRTARILVNLERRSAADLIRAFAVAVAYDLGRALALVLPVSHATRRRRART